MKKDKPSDFRKLLEIASRTHGCRAAFDAFVKLAACALSAQQREEEYLEEEKRWTREELSAFSEALAALTLEMERRPFEDVLGAYYMEFALSTKGQQWNGEFHTPKAICDLMARMTFDLDRLPTEGPITVSEPACGAGAMILAICEVCPPDVRRRLRVTATDVNRTACDMTFVNTTLWGIPCEVIHGNTISLEVWHHWRNIHWLCPFLHRLAAMPDAAPQMPPDVSEVTYPAPAEIEAITAPDGQREFALV